MNQLPSPEERDRIIGNAAKDLFMRAIYRKYPEIVNWRKKDIDRFILDLPDYLINQFVDLAIYHARQRYYRDIERWFDRHPEFKRPPQE